jgi:hypothetical protein
MQFQDKKDRTASRLEKLERKSIAIARYTIPLAVYTEQYLDLQVEKFWIDEEIDTLKIVQEMERRVTKGSDEINATNYNFADHFDRKKARYEHIIGLLKLKYDKLETRVSRETDEIKAIDIELEMDDLENEIYSKQRFLQKYEQRFKTQNK